MLTRLLHVVKAILEDFDVVAVVLVAEHGHFLVLARAVEVYLRISRTGAYRNVVGGLEWRAAAAHVVRHVEVERRVVAVGTARVVSRAEVRKVRINTAGKSAPGLLGKAFSNGRSYR